jgi:hypothetical protein
MSPEGKVRQKAAGRSGSPAAAATAKRPGTSRRSPSKPERQRGSLTAGTVVMQARVDADFAAELLEHDAPALGLEGVSALVRAGLLLLHRRARELTAAAEYEKFYGGQPAPLPGGVLPADAE